MVTPVGSIELKNGGANFRSLHDWFAIFPLLVAAGLEIILLAANDLAVGRMVEKQKGN